MGAAQLNSDGRVVGPCAPACRKKSSPNACKRGFMENSQHGGLRFGHRIPGEASMKVTDSQVRTTRLPAPVLDDDYQSIQQCNTIGEYTRFKSVRSTGNNTPCVAARPALRESRPATPVQARPRLIVSPAASSLPFGRVVERYTQEACEDPPNNDTSEEPLHLARSPGRG